MTAQSNFCRTVLLVAIGLVANAAAMAADGFKVPGTSIVVLPYIETEGGYDSNPDNFVDKTGSAFTKIEGGLKAESDVDGRYYGLTLKGKDVHFDNL
jgi:hypothetical protein